MNSSPRLRLLGAALVIVALWGYISTSRRTVVTVSEDSLPRCTQDRPPAEALKAPLVDLPMREGMPDWYYVHVSDPGRGATQVNGNHVRMTSPTTVPYGYAYQSRIAVAPDQPAALEWEGRILRGRGRAAWAGAVLYSAAYNYTGLAISENVSVRAKNTLTSQVYGDELFAEIFARAQEQYGKWYRYRVEYHPAERRARYYRDGQYLGSCAWEPGGAMYVFMMSVSAKDSQSTAEYRGLRLYGTPVLAVSSEDALYALTHERGRSQVVRGTIQHTASVRARMDTLTGPGQVLSAPLRVPEGRQVGRVRVIGSRLVLARVVREGQSNVIRVRAWLPFRWSVLREVRVELKD